MLLLRCGCPGVLVCPLQHSIRLSAGATGQEQQQQSVCRWLLPPCGPPTNQAGRSK